MMQLSWFSNVLIDYIFISYFSSCVNLMLVILSIRLRQLQARSM